MKIAVLSDIHENYHNLALALERIETEKVEQVLFLGDFINAGIAQLLCRFGIPTYAVWGNNDGDKVAITKFSMDQDSNLSVAAKSYDTVEFGGRKIFMTHSPDLAIPMAKSGEFDAVFYGHNHLKNEDMIGKCLVINPGELSAHKTGIATMAIYDTDSNKAEFIELEGSISTKTDTSKEYMEKVGFEFNKGKDRKYQ